MQALIVRLSAPYLRKQAECVPRLSRCAHAIGVFPRAQRASGQDWATMSFRRAVLRQSKGTGSQASAWARGGPRILAAGLHHSLLDATAHVLHLLLNVLIATPTWGSGRDVHGDHNLHCQPAREGRRIPRLAAICALPEPELVTRESFLCGAPPEFVAAFASACLNCSRRVCDPPAAVLPSSGLPAHACEGRRTRRASDNAGGRKCQR